MSLSKTYYLIIDTYENAAPRITKRWPRLARSEFVVPIDIYYPDPPRKQLPGLIVKLPEPEAPTGVVTGEPAQGDDDDA